MTTTNTTVQNRKAYFSERTKALNLSPRQARDTYGIKPAPCGGILQEVKDFDGIRRTYLPERNRRRYDQARARRSDFVLHEAAYFEPYTVKRLHPEALRNNPNLPKYLHPKGAPAHPMPGPNAIKAHRQEITGGTVFFIEGYFKAVALDRHGIEVTAFSGISTYRIKEDVLAYLAKRKPDRVVILYDGDATAIKAPKDGAPWSDRRPRDFVASAAGFARQFFALQEQINPEALLYFAMVKPQSQHKGFDDLLQHTTPEEVLEELEELPKDGQHVQALRLHRTTYLAKLRKFFNLDTYRHFYEAHRAEIGTAPFRFEKRTYQTAGIGNLLHNSTPQYTLQDDPYKADQGGHRLAVKKYLEEITPELDRLLKEEARLAIEAPTGSGKTTFFASLPKRTGQRVVVAVPTVNLAKQQAGKVRGAVPLHGRGNPTKSNKAAEAQLVFCTYDTLHQLPDVHRRIVVIDEAHNLVNQFGQVADTYNPFRADTLRKVLELASQGKKAVFLSGTMPPLLAQALGATLVQVTRQDSNKVQVHVLEADGVAPDKLTAATLAELQRIDYTADRLHFVFMNNTEQLEAIRAHLVKAGHLEASQVEVITRRTVNQGNRRGFNSIIQKEELPGGIKLVLSTCLISEGVNINNRNIGRVLYTGNRCADTFRQYVARFRNVPTLDVWAILPRENNLRERFLKSDVAKMLNRCQRTAALQVQFAEEELAEVRAGMAPEELEHLAEIEAEKGTYQSLLFNLIYIGQDNTPRPDVLRILAIVREEKLRGINNAYFLQEITAAPNIELYSHGAANVGEHTTEAVKDATAARIEAQRAFLAETLEALPGNGPTLARALHLYYQDTGNRKSRAELEELAEEVLAEASEIEGRTYLNQHREQLEDKGARRAIRDYCKMRFAEMTAEEITAELDNYNRQRIGQMWRQLQHLATRHRYERKRERPTMHHLHSLEAKALGLIEKHLAKAAEADTGEGLTAEEITTAIMAPLRRGRYDNILNEIVTDRAAEISAQKAVIIAKTLFEVKEDGTGRNVRYHLRESFFLGQKKDKKTSENVPKVCRFFQRIKPKAPKIKALSLAGRCTT